MGQLIKQKDRVSVSYDRKINMGNYESIGIQAGYSTDVRVGESIEEAMDRAEAQASAQLEKMAEPIEKLVKPTPTRPKKKRRSN